MITQARHFVVLGLCVGLFAAVASGASSPRGPDSTARTSAIFMKVEPESRITRRQFEARWGGGESARGDAAMAAPQPVEIASR